MECERRGLLTQGRKADLVLRLKNALDQEGVEVFDYEFEVDNGTNPSDDESTSIETRNSLLSLMKGMFEKL